MYELYEIALFIKVEPFKAQLYLHFIERSVNKAILQHERIAHEDLSVRKMVEGLSEIGRFTIPFFQGADTIKRMRVMTTLFSDIHHYLICWAEVSKLYEKLIKVQPIFEAVPEKFLKALKEHRDFRNHLEHKDDRVERGVTDLGNLSGGKFSFDGKQLDISDADLKNLKLFYERLVEIACEKFEQPFLIMPPHRRFRP